MTSPIDFVEWVAKNVGFLGWIAPIFIFILAVTVGAFLINTWLKFLEAVKTILSNKAGVFVLMILFGILIWIWNQTVGGLF